MNCIFQARAWKIGKRSAQTRASQRPRGFPEASLPAPGPPRAARRAPPTLNSPGHQTSRDPRLHSLCSPFLLGLPVVQLPSARGPPGPRSVNPARGGRAVCGVPAALPGPAEASVCLPSLLGGRGDGLGMSPAPALPSRARRAARPLPVHTREARARQASPASSAWGFRGRVTEPARAASSRLFLFLRRRPPGPPCDSSLNDLPLAVARRPSRPRTSPLIHVRRGQQAALAWTHVGPVESDRL